MKKVLKILLPLLILAGAAALFMGLKSTRPEQPGAKVSERVWRVETLSVELRKLAPTLTLYGRLEAPNLHRAAAPLSARVGRVEVREGDLVEPDQLLIELDARDFEPAVEQAQAEVEELKAQLLSEQNRQEADLEALQQERRLLQLSRQSLERARRLQKQKLGSDSELDIARQGLARQALLLSSRERSITDHPARVEALKARLKRAQAGLKSAELNLERSRIVSPHAGRIASVEVAVGNQVSANQQLLTLYDPGDLELRARIPAPFLNELINSRADDYLLRGLIGDGDSAVPVRLSRLAGEAGTSGTDALFVLEQESDWLRSGQVISFKLLRQPQENVIAVPHSVVYGGNRIYKLTDGRLQGLQMEALGNYPADDGGDWLLIRAAELQAGDELVVTHLPNATDGLRVAPVAAE